jgi:maltodextrin utilization protein YvdJ
MRTPLNKVIPSISHQLVHAPSFINVFQVFIFSVGTCFMHFAHPVLLQCTKASHMSFQPFVSRLAFIVECLAIPFNPSQVCYGPESKMPLCSSYDNLEGNF